MKPVSVVEVYTTKFCHSLSIDIACVIIMTQQLLFEVSLLSFHFAFAL